MVKQNSVEKGEVSRLCDIVGNVARADRAVHPRTVRQGLLRCGRSAAIAQPLPGAVGVVDRVSAEIQRCADDLLPVGRGAGILADERLKDFSGRIGIGQGAVRIAVLDSQCCADLPQFEVRQVQHPSGDRHGVEERDPAAVETSSGGELPLRKIRIEPRVVVDEDAPREFSREEVGNVLERRGSDDVACGDSVDTPPAFAPSSTTGTPPLCRPPTSISPSNTPARTGSSRMRQRSGARGSP